MWYNWSLSSKLQGKHIFFSFVCVTNDQVKYPYQTKQLTVIEAYPQHIYATFVGSISLITGNGKELKSSFFQSFQKVESELGTKHWFLSPHHPKSNGILEKICSFLKACVRKHIHGKLDWEDTFQLSLFSVRMLPDILSKGAHSSSFFWQRPSHSSQKTSLT